MWSQLVVKLVLVSQVDPAEDECGQGQSEHHDEGYGACAAFILRLARSRGEDRPAGRVPAVSLALLAALLGTTLPGAERAADDGGRRGLGSIYTCGWKRLCLWRKMALGQNYALEVKQLLHLSIVPTGSGCIAFLCCDTA